MPRKALPARLWLRPADHDREAMWVILDRGRQIRTGCGANARGEAERQLADYIAGKHNPIPQGPRPATQTPVADVLSVYLDEVVPKQVNKAKAVERMGRLIEWWGNRMLSDVTPVACREYAASRTKGGARRDLEDLRAAINHHAKRNLHTGLVMVDLPPKGKAREEWLTREEIARLVWTCYRHGRTVRLPRGKNKGAIVESQWHDLRHLARFILMGIYTGSRSGAILSASIHAGANRSFVDLESGIFYRLADGKQETNKRQPPVRLPPRLIAHIRRWKDKGIIASHVVEWEGLPVKSIKVAWARALKLAGIAKKAPPHTLRHSAATWLMQQGVDKWEAAGFLGMSTDVLEQTYGKHHPDFMREAAAAITRKRKRQ